MLPIEQEINLASFFIFTFLIKQPRYSSAGKQRKVQYICTTEFNLTTLKTIEITAFAGNNGSGGHHIKKGQITFSLVCKDKAHRGQETKM